MSLPYNHRSGPGFKMNPNTKIRVADPDPDLNKFSAKFLLELFFGENML
jgi:hypothetical protein